MWNLNKPRIVEELSNNIKTQSLTMQEYFRVGVNNLGQTTLTIFDGDTVSLTLTMDQPTVERLIKMLKATYTPLEDTESEQ